MTPTPEGLVARLRRHERWTTLFTQDGYKDSIFKEAADHIEALEARLAAARNAMCELDGHYQKALAGWDAERTAREALEAALHNALVALNCENDALAAAIIRAALSPSGNGEGTT